MKAKLKIFLYIVLNALISLISIFVPINNKRILFESYGGSTYGCNPKYISEALVKNGSYEIIWTYKKNTDTNIFPKDISLVCKPSLKYIFIFLSSKIVIDNDSFPLYMPKRKNQILINTRHGGGAFKTIGFKLSHVSNEVKFILNKNSEMADYFLSSCKASSECFRNDLRYNGIILKTGMPRNDLFWQNNDNISKKIRDKYNISYDKKMVLYAPTFRSSAKASQNDIIPEELKKVLHKRFGGEWTVLVRAHHRFSSLCSNDDNCIDVSSYPDMQELLCCADVLISDYSSCMWDFSLMKNPCFILATDLNNFEAAQGFNTPISKWPYDIASSCDELNKNILNFNQEDYEKRLNKFLSEQGSYEDGQATKRAVELINLLLDSNKEEYKTALEIYHKKLSDI